MLLSKELIKKSIVERAFIYEINELNNWSEYLPMVQRIINTSHHGVLGCAPHDILYGTLANKFKGVFLPKVAEI